MVDAPDLGSGGVTRGGSSPPLRISTKAPLRRGALFIYGEAILSVKLSLRDWGKNTMKSRKNDLSLRSIFIQVNSLTITSCLILSKYPLQHEQESHECLE